MANSTSSEVASFLLSIKYLIQDREYTILRRPEYLATTSSLGIDETDVLDEIISLSVDEYFRGPSKDRNLKSGEVWEFGKQVLGQEVYIKLVLKGDKRGQWVTILSFHFPRFPLSYPLRKP